MPSAPRIGLDPRLVQGLVDADLVGPQGAPPLKDQHGLAVVNAVFQLRVGRHLADYRTVHRRVAHDATLADPLAAGLELRLHQQHEDRLRSGELEEIRRDQPQGDEREVDDDEVEGGAECAFVEVTEVRALDDGDARVMAQGPRELPTTDATVRTADVTLHVGLGTFLPLRVEDTADHRMHSEQAHLSQSTADALNAARAAGGRITAVGTTALRTLETAADDSGA